MVTFIGPTCPNTFSLDPTPWVIQPVLRCAADCSCLRSSFLYSKSQARSLQILENSCEKRNFFCRESTTCANGNHPATSRRRNYGRSLSKRCKWLPVRAGEVLGPDRFHF